MTRLVTLSTVVTLDDTTEPENVLFTRRKIEDLPKGDAWAKQGSSVYFGSQLSGHWETNQVEGVDTRETNAEWCAERFRGRKGRGQAAGRELGCLEFIACSSSKRVLASTIETTVVD
jgi:hypothetical protein